MIFKLLLRVALKLWTVLLRVAVDRPSLVTASLGQEGIVAILEHLEGGLAVDLLRGGGATVGTHVRISRGLVVHNSDGSFTALRVGDDCHVGREVFLDLAAPIMIGNRVTISMRCVLITHVDAGDSRCGIERETGSIEIGNDVYIGAGAIVLPGIRIGSQSVIGAGAVVTRNVGVGEVVAGVPARLLVHHSNDRAMRQDKARAKVTAKDP